MDRFKLFFLFDFIDDPKNELNKYRIFDFFSIIFIKRPLGILARVITFICILYIFCKNIY